MDGFIPKVASGRPVTAIRPTTWNKIADTINGGRLGQNAPPRESPIEAVVKVANKTGQPITKPFRAFLLGDPLWAIGTNGLPTCVFRLEAWDAASTKPVVVVQQPLIVDEVGIAVVSGPSLVECTGDGAASARAGNPQADGRIVPGSGSRVTYLSDRPSGGGVVLAVLGVAGETTKYFKLAEDHLPGRNWIYAYASNVSGVVATPAPTPVQLFFAGSLMSGARVDYLVQANRIDGNWNFAQGECIATTCGATNGSSIQPGSPPVGVVGDAYSHSITQSGLSGSITATGLPPGLSFSGSAFSGTPTEAGEFFAKLVGPKTVGSTSCPVTRLVRIQIDEE